MATNKQQTTNYKYFFWCVLLIFLGLLGRWGYLKVSNLYMKYDIVSVKKEISKREKDLANFSDRPGYDKLQYVQELEENNSMMPWSDHVNAIMEIFDDLLDVDKSDTHNISFSDFEISLESIKLNGNVINLRLLYQGANSNTGLISRFEALDFLDNISIKTYEKSEEEGKLGYDFTLTANVINNNGK